MRVEPTLGSTSDWQALARKAVAAQGSVDRAALYAAAIGPRNQAHYLARFKAFDRHGGLRIGWHWPAFFLTVHWLLYRKLWWQALGCFAVPYVLLVMAAVLVPMVGADRAVPVCLGLIALLFVVPALLADGMYHAHCQRLIDRARSETADARVQQAWLARAGGTSKVVAVLFWVLLIPALLGIVAAVALPAYQDYTVRIKVTQAFSQARTAGEAVGLFYGRNRRLPRDLAEAGFVATMPATELRELQMDARSGVITAVMNHGVVAGRSLVLVPTVDAGGNLSWTCKSQTMAARWLPAACR
uniref:DUF2628 domain-containing protein n=1 Tax=unclassified Variovorax TaxID=663243 RepID=UPI000D34B4B2